MFPESTGGNGPPSGFSNRDMDYRKWNAPYYNQNNWIADERSASNSPDYPLIG